MVNVIILEPCAQKMSWCREGPRFVQRIGLSALKGSFPETEQPDLLGVHMCSSSAVPGCVAVDCKLVSIGLTVV